MRRCERRDRAELPGASHAPLIASPRTQAAAALALSAAFVVCAHASAHDYWIEASTFLPVVGDRVDLHLLVGEALVPEEERVMQQARAARFVHVSAAGIEDLRPTSIDGAMPFATLSLVTEGTHLVHLERTFATLTLPADRFERYLHGEGLDAIVRERRRRGERAREGRERYARCIDLLLRVGEASDETFRRGPDCRIAIVPDVDPSLLHARSRLGVLVLFDGAPFAGAALAAAIRDAGGRVLGRSAVTDANGHALLVIPGAGTVVLHTVHMERSTDPATDWESWWASYTFAVRRQ